MNKLKIFSYNIHKGFSFGSNRFTLNKMREQIRILDPDLIFLQEIHGEHTTHRKNIAQWPDISQFEFIAENIWPHFSYGKNAIYSEGHHGNAILSKYPIQNSKNINISTNTIEHRGLLHVDILLPDHKEPLYAFCTHLNLLEKSRAKQINEIANYIKNNIPKNSMMILAGDFNDWRKKANAKLHKSLKLLEACLEYSGNNAKTFPSIYPLLSLDRVYYRGLDIKEAKCLQDSPWNSLSDHLPLHAVFDLTPPTK